MQYILIKFSFPLSPPRSLLLPLLSGSTAFLCLLRKQTSRPVQIHAGPVHAASVSVGLERLGSSVASMLWFLQSSHLLFHQFTETWGPFSFGSLCLGRHQLNFSVFNECVGNVFSNKALPSFCLCHLTVRESSCPAVSSKASDSHIVIPKVFTNLALLF